MEARARKLRVIGDEELRPRPEQVAKVLASVGAPDGGAHDWYGLLHGTQGSLDLTLASGNIVDYSDFALDSLFCEWGYLVNFEAGFLEVYRGFQKEPHEEGRFGGRPRGKDPEYYPVRMVAAYSLAELPEPERFLRDLSGDEAPK